MGILTRWYAVGDSILEGWIGFNKSSDVDKYLQHFKGNDFWSLDFLDTYLPSQPALLCAITLLGLLSATLFISFLIVCATKLLTAKCGEGDSRIGGSGYYSSYSFLASYLQVQKPSWMKLQGSKRWTVPMVGFCVVWTIMLFTLLLYALCLVDFGSQGFGRVDGGKIISGNIKTVAVTGGVVDKHVFIESNTVSIHDDGSHKHAENAAHISEDQLLRKFDDIRELGYEFKPMERESASLLKYLLFIFTIVFYSASLLLSTLAVAIGLRRQKTRKIRDPPLPSGKVLAAVGILMLGASPFINTYATFLVLQSHAHWSLCPGHQAKVQNSNIEDYVNENYGAFGDPTILVDFLADLGRERVLINNQNCRENAYPIQGAWLCLFFLAWASLPMTLFSVWLSRHIIRDGGGCAPPPYAVPSTRNTSGGTLPIGCPPEQGKSFIYQKY